MSTAPTICSGPPSVTFPLEIFQLIYQIIADDKHTSTRVKRMALKNGCLVCKAFLSITRPHLFYRVDLCGMGDTTGRYSRSYDLRRALAEMANRPQNSIARYIRVISYDYYEEAQNTRIGRGHVEDFQLSTLLHLPKVSELTIGCSRSVVTTDFAKSDPEAFGWRRLLDAYLPMANLTTLTLQRIMNLPLITILLSSPNLTSLDLHYCDSAPEPSLLPTQPVLDGEIPHIALQRLLLSESDDLPFRIFPYLTNLRYLEAQVIDDDEIKWEDQPHTLPFGNLETLIIHARNGGIDDVSEGWTKWFHPPGWIHGTNPAPSLKYLEIHDDEPIMMSFLFDLTEGLDTLAIETNCLAPVEVHRYIRQHKGGLRTLKICNDDIVGWHTNIRTKGFIDSLELMRGQNTFIELVISGTFQLVDSFESIILDQEDDWRRIKAMLTATNTSDILDFPSFEKLSINFTVQPYGPVQFAETILQCNYLETICRSVFQPGTRPDGSQEYILDVDICFDSQYCCSEAQSSVEEEDDLETDSDGSTGGDNNSAAGEDFDQMDEADGEWEDGSDEEEMNEMNAHSIEGDDPTNNQTLATDEVISGQSNLRRFADIALNQAFGVVGEVPFHIEESNLHSSSV